MRLRAAYLRMFEAGRQPPAGIAMRPFILTGPPRSGTSLMTALLTRKANVLVANEPVVVSDPLLAKGDPARLLRGYINAVARQAISKGTFSTKVDPAKPNQSTTDTANRGAVRKDVPVTIDTALPLCIGVKHPISFMEYLDELTSGWDELKVIVLVRRPGPTIRSWRETTYGWQPGIDDPKKGLWRRMYGLIPACDSPLERRAHLWRILVERGEQFAREKPQQVVLQRYEELLADPAAVMARLFRHIGAAKPDAPIDTSDVKPQARDSYKGFTDEEAAMIERIDHEADERTMKEFAARLRP